MNVDVRRKIEQSSQSMFGKLAKHLADRERLCVVKAPPGSGKTYTLLKALETAVARSENVAVATQTNAQADDACRRIVRDYPHIDVHRFGAGGTTPPEDLDGKVRWITSSRELPCQDCLVVATVAKWALTKLTRPFDVLFVDEAWQMAWSDFMLLSRVAGRFVLIGDPGQIPPVVSVPVHRWEVSPRAPHRAAPEILLADLALPKLELELPSCRRLPADSVELVRGFYDFPFDAWAAPEDRFVRCGRARRTEAIDRALDVMDGGSIAVATLPTPEEGPPLECDREIAALAARIAMRALERKATAAAEDDGEAMPLQPFDIGISATHRSMNAEILARLPEGVRCQTTGIRVDTPERWQGLERKLMIVVHPLSGVIRPSAFDLETGRLCVMASRHRSGLIIVSRDHVPATLEAHIPSAEQALGRPDAVGRGHLQNLRLWNALFSAGRVVHSH